MPTDKGIGAYGAVTIVKGTMHINLGQNALAMDTFRQADEFFIEAESKGSVARQNRSWWKDIVAHLATTYFDSRQLEAAKQCYLRLLSWPGVSLPGELVNGLSGMACYHKERREGVKVTEYAQEGLAVIPEAKKHFPIGRLEERFLLLLAEAAEELGGMELAREIDVIAKKFWTPKNLFSELVACYRRDAVVLLAEGKVQEAAHTLRCAPQTYASEFDLVGIVSKLTSLEPQMAACKVGRRLGADRNCS